MKLPRRSICLSTALLATAVAGGCLASTAAAEFGPIKLVSKSPREQAKFATEPVISADGRYLAFCGSIGGKEGIFREQLESGALAPVAAAGAGTNATCGEGSYAKSPSISADGRYVSFNTRAALDPADDAEPETRDVYVADMATSPPSYELASVGDGSSAALSGGSLAAGRDALSEGGRRVAFVHQGNVYVRDLGTEETILISAGRDSVTGEMTSEPPPGGGAYEGAGAAISGDGSTVAWVGEHLPEQVLLLSDEEDLIRRIELEAEGEESYHEPLWRRVPTFPGDRPPTRRVIGGGDPTASGCPLSGTLAEPACQGPYPELAKGRRIPEYVRGVGWGVSLPQLSSDGDTVATIGNPEEDKDLFVVDMSAGLDRRQAVHQITRWTNPIPSADNPETALRDHKYWPFTGEVIDCAISPDGNRIAFTTTRQNFPLAPPTLITQRPVAPGALAELYQVDLAGGVMERATPGPGQDISLGAGAGAASPSYGVGGRLLAFSSSAYNLVPGDANENTDAFVVETPPPAPVGAGTISAHPPTVVLKPSWHLTANAYSRPNGSVRVVAAVPGAGMLRARANAQLGARLAAHRVARGKRRAPKARVVRIDLKLPSRLRHLSRRQGGLATTITVSFAGKGGQPLRALMDTRFRVHKKAHRKHGKGAGG